MYYIQIVMLLFFSIHSTICFVTIGSITQDAKITFNGFVCPVKATGDVACSDQISTVEGFKLSSNQTVMIFSSQVYWLKAVYDEKQKILATPGGLQSMKSDWQNLAKSAQDNSENLASNIKGTFTNSSSKDTALSSRIKNDDQAVVESIIKSKGMGTDGGYCLLISTDATLSSIVKPALIVNQNEIKVVVQLWYNGNGMLELWSQDAAAIPLSGTFDIRISDVEQSSNGGLPPSGTNQPKLFDVSGKKSWKNNLYSMLEITPARSTVDATHYGNATKSPRSVFITQAM